MSALINLVSLTKKYSAGQVESSVLLDLNLEILAKEFISIMGPSGSGKSTLLNILGLLDNSYYGTYFFEGRDVSAFTENQHTKFRKENIGLIFQDFNLIDNLTVYENIELPLLYLKMDSTERSQRIQVALEKLNIVHRRNYFPSQLSGGQRQRVAIARATIARPKLILADEPTGNLDSVQREEIMNFLLELNEEGITIIMVTHSSHDAGRAHRIINLFDGRIVKNVREPFIL